MNWTNKLGKLISFVPRKINSEVEDQIADKTKVAVLAAMQQLDLTSPVLTTLLAGGTIKAEITIRLVDADGASVK